MYLAALADVMLLLSTSPSPLLPHAPRGDEARAALSGASRRVQLSRASAERWREARAARRISGILFAHADVWITPGTSLIVFDFDQTVLNCHAFGEGVEPEEVPGRWKDDVADLDTFRAFVAEHYRGVSFLDVVKLTASHYFGIVPLHVNQDHRLAYLQTATALMSSIPRGE